MDPDVACAILAVRDMTRLGGEGEWKRDALSVTEIHAQDRLTDAATSGRLSGEQMKRISVYLHATGIHNFHQLRAQAHAAGSHHLRGGGR